MEVFHREEKRKKKVYYSLCFICQTKSKAPFTQKPALENVEKFLKAATDSIVKLNTLS